jgi:hypothetical protein
MAESIDNAIAKELDAIREAGLFKKERIITTPQSAKFIRRKVVMY